LKKVITQPQYAEEVGQNARKISERIEKFDEYIEEMINLYKKILEDG
jgi:hypothetical protein